MAWDFSTEPEFQEKLDWATPVRRGQDRAARHPLSAPAVPSARRRAAAHRRPDEAGRCATRSCGPRTSGRSWGARGTARSSWPSSTRSSGCRAGPPSSSAPRPPTRGTPRSSPTTGPRSRRRSTSSRSSTGRSSRRYSMTEPQAGSDPQQFTCSAVRDGDEWVINGWKYFSSNARTAAFLIVMVVTDPDVPVYKGASMFLVPTDTPGVEHRAPRRAQRRVRGRGHARPHPLRGRAGPRREPAGGRGPGLRHRPDAPRVAGGSITPCGPSPCASGPSTCCASGC